MITKESLAVTPYSTHDANKKPAVGRRRDDYWYRDSDLSCDIDLAPLPDIDGKMISKQNNPEGSAIFLPWEQNKICYARLPAPTPTGGVQFFYTSVMHGCKFYVDSIRGSKDVIVYHANAYRMDPGGHQVPSDQLPAATNMLEQLHRRAQRGCGQSISKTIIEFGKAEYFGVADPIVALKQDKVDRRQTKWDIARIRHREISWDGRCFVCAFPTSGREWDFWFQTWGEVTYTRPSGTGHIIAGLLSGHYNYARKALWSKLKKRNKEIVRDMSVLDSGTIPRVGQN